MQRIKSSKLHLGLAFATGFAIGIISLILFKKFSEFTLQDSITLGINPVEFVAIIINVLLALYIGKTIGKQNDSDRAEKDILISSYENFGNQVDNVVREFLDTRQFDTAIVRSQFKTLRRRRQSLEDLAAKYELKTTGTEKDCPINKPLSELWELFTDSPRTVSSDASKELQDDVEYVNMQKISDIESKATEVSESIFEVIISINRK
ncbi:DEAD/DEAH box helicase family protein [Sphingobacterium corticibacter]|uniref:Uncharacterized protein n=1 Tax=Sphingobacterium corticibacter TaxID=2171749 RepID=A0A2T8HNH0_9SPHI|nr:hypothetical protein [Sphingobacterium corticibacter]PVH26999.1 hypothetical protein DC487_05230 [Sphingobacterium corticibacter]